MENTEKFKGPFTTHKEKWLTILLIFLVLCVLGLVIAVIVLAIPKEEPAKPVKPCMGKTCLKSAVSIMDNIDLKAKPCNDFWKYACGNFFKSHQVYSFEDEAKYSVFQKMSDRLQRRLLGLLAEEDTKDTISPVKKLKKLFNSCIDQEMSDNITMKEIMTKAIEFGGIPIVTGDMKQNRTTIDLLTDFAKSFSTFPFIVFDVHRNFFSGKGNTLYLATRPAGEHVFKFIEEIAKQLNQSSSYNASEITSFMDTYTELFDVQPTYDITHLVKSKPRTISEIMESFPDFDLESFINGMLNMSGSKLEKDSAIVILGEEELRNLTSLIANTSQESLLNIMSAMLMMEFQSTLGSSLTSTKTKLHGEELKTENTRVDHCLTVCKHYAPRVIGKLYVEKYFPDENKKMVSEIAEYLGKALSKVMQENTWLDDQSKKAVMKKVEALKRTKSIGYDPSLISDEFLNKRFEDVNVTDNLYENIFEYDRLLLVMKLKSYKATATHKTSIINSVTINAIYNALFNTLSVSAAILQPPIFQMNISQAFNFGSIGTIIGHEMMHAFDPLGVKFDANGNVGNMFTNSSQVKYDDLNNKLINKYSNFLMPSVNETVNGSLTAAENVADLAGIKISYLAYKLWAEDKQPELKLPGLSLTSDQLFFTSFTQVWCENKSKSLLKTQMKIDVHSPSRARTTVTLQNTKQFSEAYYCRGDTNMNQPKKVVIW